MKIYLTYLLLVTSSICLVLAPSATAKLKPADITTVVAPKFNPPPNLIGRN